MADGSRTERHGDGRGLAPARPLVGVARGERGERGRDVAGTSPRREREPAAHRARRPLVSVRPRAPPLMLPPRPHRGAPKETPMSHYHDPADLKLLPELKKLAPAEFAGFVALDGVVGREDGAIPRKYRELIAIAV